MTALSVNPERPTFRLGEVRTLSLAEVTAMFGDPALNTHIEENRNDTIELSSTTGEPYNVHLGLPSTTATVGAYGAVKQYDTPYEPHVFTADRFILRSKADPNKLLVDAPNLNILFMHGRRNNSAWVPSSPVLEQSGVTIPHFLTSFEAVTRTMIDVVWVCQVDPANNQNALQTSSGHPRIYPVAGYAQGDIRLERGVLTVSLQEKANENSLVEYQAWQDALIRDTAK